MIDTQKTPATSSVATSSDTNPAMKQHGEPQDAAERGNEQPTEAAMDDNEYAAALTWIDHRDWGYWTDTPTPVEKIEVNATIRRALLLADKVTKEPSAKMAMVRVTPYDQITTQNPNWNIACFEAMVQQAIKEVQDGE